MLVSFKNSTVNLHHADLANGIYRNHRLGRARTCVRNRKGRRIAVQVCNNSTFYSLSTTNFIGGEGTVARRGQGPLLLNETLHIYTFLLQHGALRQAGEPTWWHVPWLYLYMLHMNPPFHFNTKLLTSNFSLGDPGRPTHVLSSICMCWISTIHTSIQLHIHVYHPKSEHASHRGGANVSKSHLPSSKCPYSACCITGY